jgi:hypothetical protein
MIELIYTYSSIDGNVCMYWRFVSRGPVTLFNRCVLPGTPEQWKCYRRLWIWVDRGAIQFSDWTYKQRFGLKSPKNHSPQEPESSRFRLQCACRAIGILFSHGLQLDVRLLSFSGLSLGMIWILLLGFQRRMEKLYYDMKKDGIWETLYAMWTDLEYLVSIRTGPWAPKAWKKFLRLGPRES